MNVSEAETSTEPTVVSPAVHKRLMSGFPGYAFAMLVCLAVVGGIMLLSPSRTPNGIPPAVDYSIDQINAASTAPYTVYAPHGLGPKWVPTSSRLTGTAGKGVVAWHLGFVTPLGQYAALEQSDERPTAFVPQITGPAVAKGQVQVAGVTWQEVYRASKKQDSLVRRLPGSTIVISGTADYRELATLAASLQPQPHKS